MFAANTPRIASAEKKQDQDLKSDPKEVIRCDLTRISRCYGSTAPLPDTFRDVVTVLRVLASGTPQ